MRDYILEAENVCFISDLHLGHDNIIKYERGHFKDIEEHDKKVIEVMKTASDKDLIIILGDLTHKRTPEYVFNLLSEVSAKMILILGNHDFTRGKCINSGLFEKVYDSPVFLSDRIVLSHHPIKVNDSVLNVHGHLHGSYIDNKNYINMNIHMREYRMWTLKEVQSYVDRKLPRENYTFPNEWYGDMVAKGKENKH